jgi:predicted DNA-binding transcriptional regulator AlpA
MATTPHAGRFIPLPSNGQKCPVTGLCRASIYNKAAEGELRLIKIGRSVRLDAEHAAQWMADQPTHTVKRTLPKKANEQGRAA